MSFLFIIVVYYSQRKKRYSYEIAKKEHDWKNFCFLKISAKNNNNFLI